MSTSLFRSLYTRRGPLGSTYRRRQPRLNLEQLEARDCPSHYGSPEVPAYSSLPGANHTIYLDFNGFVTENTPWNNYYNNPSIDSPPYDIDSDPTTFNAEELARIEEIWNRVTEDFIPFHVNVTTVDPGIEALRKVGAEDTQWGIRNVVTADTEGCGCGGIAYIDSFNWDIDNPVFVYNTGAKSVAEASSHEVGHSLGLSHDGTSTTGYYTGHGNGETGWAPLMGVGYYQNVSTWSRGDYYDSNNAGPGANYNKGPDDLAIITSYNGFGYRVDDHGNTNSTATPLTLSGTSVSGAGIISTASDVDVFSFTTGAGLVNLNISPFFIGPNLDVKADLYNAAGQLVATSNLETTLSGSFSLSLEAGQYFLRIDGTGWGTPLANPPSGYTEYASLGRYTITGTIGDSTPTPELSINDVTVNEADGTATFTVTLTGVIASTATVDFATANDSASAGGDYVGTSGSLTFSPGGATTQSVTVSILNDALTESTETFFVNLTNAAGAAILDGQGLGTIVDNDVTPQLNISATSAAKREGTSSTPTPFTFTVARLGSSDGASSAHYAVTAISSGKSAVKPDDFDGGVFPSGTVSFAAGETSKTITILVRADSAKEANENFRVTLSNAAGGTIGTASADGQIANDDGGKPGGIVLCHLPRLYEEGEHEDDDHHHHPGGAPLSVLSSPSIRDMSFLASAGSEGRTQAGLASGRSEDWLGGDPDNSMVATLNVTRSQAKGSSGIQGGSSAGATRTNHDALSWDVLEVLFSHLGRL